MTEIKHNPGPWTLKLGELYDPNGERVRFSGDGFAILCGGADERMDKARANGRLALAAPILLDRLKETAGFLRVICGNTDDLANEVLVAAEAAVAQAEGRSATPSEPSP